MLKTVGSQLEVLELEFVLSSEKSPNPDALSPSASRFSLPSLKSLYISSSFVARDIALIPLIESYGEARK